MSPPFAPTGNRTRDPSCFTTVNKHSDGKLISYHLTIGAVGGCQQFGHTHTRTQNLQVDTARTMVPAAPRIHLRNHHRLSTHTHTNKIDMDSASQLTWNPTPLHFVGTHIYLTMSKNHTQTRNHTSRAVARIRTSRKHTPSPTHRVSLPLAPRTTMQQHKMPSTSKHRQTCVRACSTK